MIEYLVGVCLLLLTIGHAILIHGCMKWSVERRVSTGMIDDRLAALAALIDEALDMFSSATDEQPVTHTGLDLKSLLMESFMQRLTNNEAHGSTQTEQEDRQIQQGDTTQTQTQTDD